MSLTNTDAYKLSHEGFMEPDTQVIYSNLTPRSFNYLPVNKEDFDGKVVWFGLQYVICDLLLGEWNDDFFNKSFDQVLKRYKRIFDNYLGKDSVSMRHFKELHELGYLPIEIKALPEGSLVPAKVPFFTIKNTHEDFAWLTNYLETVISCELWKPTTVATLIRQYRLLANDFSLKTTGSTEGTEFQIHGFEFRGMSGRQDAAVCGAAFLLSSNGTDTIPAIEFLEDYYCANGDQEFIAASVPASEHSLASTGIAVRGELETYRKWITEDYPTGIVSVIADTLDFFKVVTEFAEELKEDILSRKVNALGLAKVVFRPDSGDPEDILCGVAVKRYDGNDRIGDLKDLKAAVENDLHDELTDNTPHGECGGDISKLISFKGNIYKAIYSPDWNRYDKQYYFIDNYGDDHTKLEEITLAPEQKGAVECLWDIFGGTVTEQGYKVLNERVGLIYGDSITLERAKDIFTRLEEKGFASTNVVLGVGSYTSQYLTRDSAGIAMKATAAKVGGEWYALSKDPKTDGGTKKSAKGLLRVEEEDGTFVLYDEQTPEQEDSGALQAVFKNGDLVAKTSLAEIRGRLWNKN